MKEPLAAEFVTLDDVLETHEEMIRAAGGNPGVKDAGLLGSALAFSLINDHPFYDGNKRAGHAAMLLFLDITAVIPWTPRTSRSGSSWPSPPARWSASSSPSGSWPTSSRDRGSDGPTDSPA